MSFISNKNQSTKRFDFVVKTDNCIYGIETNFYATGGSKLNETARAIKCYQKNQIKLQALNLYGLQMEWVGFRTRNNLKETFDRMDNMYNIADMKNGVMKKIFNQEIDYAGLYSLKYLV